MTTLWPSPKILAFNVLTRNVPIPDEVKKFNSIFISIQLSEMNGSLRVKINDSSFFLFFYFEHIWMIDDLRKWI